MSPVAKSKQKPRDLQREFDWLWNHSRQLLTVKEVAEAFGTTDMHVRNLVDEGQLLAGYINTDEDPQRRHLKITRLSAYEFFCRRFGNPMSPSPTLKK